MELIRMRILPANHCLQTKEINSSKNLRGKEKLKKANQNLNL